MSLKAVSCEHLARAAHLDEVSLSLKPSNSRLRINRWRLLNDKAAQDCQKRALVNTVASVSSTPSKARLKQPRNHSNPSVGCVKPLQRSRKTPTPPFVRSVVPDDDAQRPADPLTSRRSNGTEANPAFHGYIGSFFAPNAEIITYILRKSNLLDIQE
jgi:hypothetical protein